MKKILYIFILSLFILGCKDDYKRIDVKSRKTKNNEYLNIDGCKYYKIKVLNHTVYQYKFATYMGTGSDIIHFEDMCDYCKSNKLNYDTNI